MFLKVKMSYPRSAGPKLHDMKQVSFGRFPCEMPLAFLTLSLWGRESESRYAQTKKKEPSEGLSFLGAGEETLTLDLILGKDAL